MKDTYEVPALLRQADMYLKIKKRFFFTVSSHY